MSKLTKKEIKNKFASVIPMEKIIDVVIYKDGMNADVLTLRDHMVNDYMITVVDNTKMRVWVAGMVSKKFNSLLWSREIQ